MNKVVCSLPSGKGKGIEKRFEWIPFREKKEKEKESSHERKKQKRVQ